MVIEWLKFRVDSKSREKFIQKDEVIWTASLSTYPGFLGKEVWIEPNEADTVIFYDSLANSRTVEVDPRQRLSPRSNSNFLPL